MCRAAEGHYGVWVPAVEEVVTAGKVLPTHCFGPEARTAAILGCAARIGTPVLTVGLGTLEEGVICEESFLPASWNGRHWIVLSVTVFTTKKFVGATGSTYTAELKGAGATRYVEDAGQPCSSNPSPGPPDWATLPPDLARFLCGQGG